MCSRLCSWLCFWCLVTWIPLGVGPTNSVCDLEWHGGIRLFYLFIHYFLFIFYFRFYKYVYLCSHGLSYYLNMLCSIFIIHMSLIRFYFKASTRVALFTIDVVWLFPIERITLMYWAKDVETEDKNWKHYKMLLIKLCVNYSVIQMKIGTLYIPTGCRLLGCMIGSNVSRP